MNVCVVRFLASLVVVPVVILILLNANTNHVTTTTGTRVAENGAAGSVVEGVAGLIALESKNDDNEKTRLPDDFVESSSPPIDVCARLRKTLRGNATAAEFLRRLLPRMYQQMGLMPSNSRLVLKILLTTTGVGLCNARTLVLDSLVLAALVGADVVLPEVHSLVGSCFKPMKANNTTSSSSAFTCFSQHVPPIARQLEGYFDVQHLRGEWKRFCPSMVLYHDRWSEGSRGPFLQELEHNHHAVVARQSLAKTLIVGSTRSDQNAIVNNVEGRLNKMDVAIRRWLAKRKRSARMKNANYFVVNILRKDLWDWSLPVEDASLGEVRRAIGASLRSPEYITRIATPVVEHLKALGEAAGSGQRFCGAHLRSEPDMQQMGNFANGTRLTDTYLEAFVAAGTKQCGVLYVAAGTKADLSRFSALAATLGITLITLSMLTTTTTLLNATSGWSYSQKAALEYEILAASHKFLGASVSSFSWNLAIRRFFSQSTNALPLRYIIRPLESIPYQDALSTIYFGTNRSRALNTHEHRALQGMWP